jgi:hypothetical protein
LGRAAKQQDGRFTLVTVNGQPGAIAHIEGGHVVSTVSLEIAEDKVVAIHAVVNPDKLERVPSPA